jgi:Holliday junction DNA helicase RuvA
MIAYLEGKVHAVRVAEVTSVVVLVAGVGYACSMPKSAPTQLQVGDTVSLHTSQVVREDSLKLYAFESEDERDLFEQLINVSGIGPRIALAMLGAHGYNNLVSAIEQSDVKLLSSTPGLGAKGASKIILELNGKLIAPETPANQVDSNREVTEKLVSAITSLGYKTGQANQVAKSVTEQLSSENRQLTDQDLPELLRQALQQL